MGQLHKVILCYYHWRLYEAICTAVSDGMGLTPNQAHHIALQETYGQYPDQKQLIDKLILSVSLVLLVDDESGEEMQSIAELVLTHLKQAEYLEWCNSDAQVDHQALEVAKYHLGRANDLTAHLNDHQINWVKARLDSYRKTLETGAIDGDNKPTLMRPSSDSANSVESDIDHIDKVMPSEADQEQFAQGLNDALRVLVEYLPPGAIDEIRRKLADVQMTHHVEAPTAGLAVGMVGFWLYRIQDDVECHLGDTP